MKITRSQLRRLINESIGESAFQFTLNPLDYINNELSYEELRHMIEMILDAHDIDYEIRYHNHKITSNLTRTSVEYIFGFEPDNPKNQRNYEAFHALLDVLVKAEIPTKQMATRGKNKRKFYASPRYSAIDSSDSSGVGARLFKSDGGILNIVKPHLIRSN